MSLGRERTDKPLVIWGSGAMGGSIGAALSEAGRQVLFVDRAWEHVEAMRNHGLRIQGPVQEITVSVEARHTSEVAGEYPLILLCVKAHHTREATEQLEPHLSDQGAVVSIQNGLCELEIAEMVGPGRTVGAFVNFGADYLSPGVIHRGNRGATVVGELDGSVGDRIQGIYKLMKLFEPRAVLTDNIFGFLWGKLAYASLLFATALTDDPIHEVLAWRECRRVLIALAREAVGVAIANGIRLEPFDGFDPMAFRPDGRKSRAHESLDDLVTFNRASAKTHSGIWRDLAVRKRPTEVDAQLGWIVRTGHEVGVSTSMNRVLIGLVHEIEAGDRELGRDNLMELEAMA